MKLQDLVDLVKLKPVIKFGGNVDDLESYPEVGMHARLVGIDSTEKDLIKVTVDYSEFEEENKILEGLGFFDKEGNATLTARQAGFYSPQEKLYIDAEKGNVSCEQYFQVVNPTFDKLFACYQDERNFGETYSEWLQSQAEPLPLESRIEFSPNSSRASLTMNSVSDNFNPLLRAGLSMIRRFGLESVSVAPLKDGQNIGVESVTITPQSKLQELKDRVTESNWKAAFESNPSIKI